MMKKNVSTYWLMVMTLVCALSTSAQKKITAQKPASDAVAVARAHWKVIKVSPGIKLKHCSIAHPYLNWEVVKKPREA